MSGNFKKRDDKKGGPKKRFDRSGAKPFRKKEGDDRGERKPFDRSDRKPFKKKEEGSDSRERKPFDRSGKKPFRKKEGDDRGERKSFDRSGRKPFKKREDDRSSGERKSFDRSDRKPFRKKEGDDRGERKVFDRSERKPFKRRDSDEGESPVRDKGNFGRPFKKKYVKRDSDSGEEKPSFKKTYSKEYGKQQFKKFEKKLSRKKGEEIYVDDGLMRLNKYIAHAGICSRREADEMIGSGVVTVNGEVITQMGYKVKPDDVVKYNGAKLKHENKVYILLNKPKDYITTSDDPQNRRTVLDLVQGACRERIYPVGRLDRNTTGLLLFTNDGELTTKLTHPRHGIRKVYKVTLDKQLTKADFDRIEAGVELEDGPIKPDSISYLEDADKNEVGIEIHSGRNRIVRRIFETLGYDVVKLDRVTFAGLTKKNLPRGEWRHLTEKEIAFLKMLS